MALLERLAQGAQAAVRNPKFCGVNRNFFFSNSQDTVVQVPRTDTKSF
jgi:hypothetical protein